MKLFYLLRLQKQKKLSGTDEFHTSSLHKHDQSDGCEFLDEPIHMNDKSFGDIKLGEY